MLIIDTQKLRKKLKIIVKMKNCYIIIIEMKINYIHGQCQKSFPSKFLISFEE